MRKQCQRCGSHDVKVTNNEVICNNCDTTIDFVIAGSWAYDAQPMNISKEKQMYALLYKGATE